MIGNSSAQLALKKIFDQLTAHQGSQEVMIPFLLLSGPEHVGKTSMLLPLVKEYLGAYMHQDFLPIYDHSEFLGKKQTLKISVPSTDQAIIDDDGVHYHNLGSREIVQRLSRSSVGGRKIVLLENIERMSNEAANALLKSLEEPLPGRLIVATTRNYKFLLDTIVSRALIIRFNPVGYNEVLQRTKETYSTVDEAIVAFAVASSAGSPGIIDRLLGSTDQKTAKNDNDQLEEMSLLFNKILAFYKQGGSVTEQYQRLQEWVKQYGTLHTLLQSVLYSLDPIEDASYIDRIITAKKFHNTTVSVDTILFYLSCDKNTVNDSIV